MTVPAMPLPTPPLPLSCRTAQKIKRLQKAKETSGKKQKALRTRYDTLKDDLAASMNRYQTSQTTYDSVSTIAGGATGLCRPAYNACQT